MNWLSVTLFMTFLSIYGLLRHRQKEEQFKKERDAYIKWMDDYYKRDQISVKKLVTRYKNERKRS